MRAKELLCRVIRTCCFVPGAAVTRAQLLAIVAFSSFWAILLPASGQLLPEWTATYDSTRHDFGANMTLDGQGNVCVLVDSFGDFATVKYAPDGTLLWTDTYDSSQEDLPGNITADGAGNLW